MGLENFLDQFKNDNENDNENDKIINQNIQETSQQIIQKPIEQVKPKIKITLNIKNHSQKQFNNSVKYTSNDQNNHHTDANNVTEKQIKIKVNTQYEQSQQNIQQKVQRQPKMVHQDIKKDKHDEEYINKLFSNSDTDEKFKEQWLDLYNKAKLSKKHNIYVDKMVRGRFTINSSKQVEILPDLDIKDKTCNQLLHMKWL
jgi:hypothetical protein